MFILDKYITKIILNFVFITLFLLTGLSSVIKFIDQSKKVLKIENHIILKSIAYTILNIPKDIENFFPISILIGTILGLNSLSQYNELIAIQSCGFSKLKIFLLIIKFLFLILIIFSIFTELTIPKSEKLIYQYQLKSKEKKVIIFEKKNSFKNYSGNLINIENILNLHTLKNVSLYYFDKNNNLKKIIYATYVKFNLKKKMWYLIGVKESNITSLKISHVFYFAKVWRKNFLNPNILNIFLTKPNYISITNLNKYVEYLKNTHQNFLKYELYMWKKILHPISSFTILFTGLTILFSKSTFIKYKNILIGLLISVIFYISDHIFSFLTIKYHLFPILGSIFPILILFLINILVFIFRY